MKRIIMTLSLLLTLGGAAMAQNNNTPQGNGNGQSGWPAFWPNYVLTWLNQGGNIPQPLAMKVIQEARTWGMQEHGLTLGQMVQKYSQGSLAVEFVQVAPPMLIFRVNYGGSDIIVVIDGTF